MKLSALRPCDNCGGPIAPTFYVVRYSIAVINPTKTNQILGMTQFFQGSLALGELFAEDGQAVNVAMDDREYKDLMTEIFLCNKCHLNDINLALLADKVAEKSELDEGEL